VTICEVSATTSPTTATDVERVEVHLRGEIDLTNRDRVADEVNGAITNTTTEAVVDLTEVTYLDSTALRFLFALADRLERMQVDLRIVSPAGSITRRVIELTGLDQVAQVDG
jgi:stage II sporulation protein AA (anti-sigma F factor antagonist)